MRWISVHNPTVWRYRIYAIHCIRSEASVIALLKTSCTDCVFTKEFYESDAHRNRYRIVHLPDRPTIEAAQRQAARIEMSAGVVCTKRGFAIRVLAGQYESAVKSLYPHDSERLMGKRWEISGLPLSMGRVALVEFLDTWRVTPEYTFRQGTRRTWIVRPQRIRISPKCSTIKDWQL